MVRLNDLEMQLVRQTSILAWCATLFLGLSPGHGEVPGTPLELQDLEGQTVHPLAHPTARWLAFIFTRTDCPVANVYAPEIQRLAARYAKQGVSFQLVYSDADETPDLIRRHLAEYGYSLPAFRDPGQQFAQRSGVKITPEAVIYQASGRLLYRGRIDDRHAELGRARPEPTHRDFESALDAVIAGRPVPKAAGPAVGCLIEGL